MLQLIEELRDLGLALAATSAVAGQLLQLLQGLGLVVLDQVLDLLVGHPLALADDLGDLLLERVVTPLLLKVVVDRGAKRLVAEDGAVELMLRQTAEGVGDHLGGHVVGLLKGHADRHLAHHGGAGDSGSAPVGQPAEIGDLVVHYLDADTHLVSTGQRTDLADTVRLEIIILPPKILGIHEMIFYRICVDPLVHEAIQVTHLVDISLNRSMIGGNFSST